MTETFSLCVVKIPEKQQLSFFKILKKLLQHKRIAKEIFLNFFWPHYLG